MKIATFNINNVNKRLPNLLAWLRAAKPDAVCLQELKAAHEAFPVAPIEDAGFFQLRARISGHSDDLLPGTYELDVSASGHAPFSERLILTRPMSKVIALPRAALLAGVVRAPDGIGGRGRLVGAPLHQRRRPVRGPP